MVQWLMVILTVAEEAATVIKYAKKKRGLSISNAHMNRM
jgi:hypothetical protein